MAREIREEDLCRLPGIWKVYIKIAPVKAIKMEEDFEVGTLEGRMTGQAGDYLCIGSEGELWPVRGRIFEQTYREASELLPRGVGAREGSG